MEYKISLSVLAGMVSIAEDAVKNQGFGDSSIIRLVEGDVQSLSIVLHHDQEDVDLEIRDRRTLCSLKTESSFTERR